jgi:hypothetical protein
LLVQELQGNASTILWRQAATSWQSAGIENGVAYAYTMKLLWKYRKEKVNDKAGALETILTGACWSPDRKCQAGIYIEDENMCPKCGVSPCDDLHQYWMCEHLSQDDHDDISKTQQYVRRAQDEATTNPALWLRGILPASLLLNFPIPQPIQTTQISIFDPCGLTNAGWPSGTYGTDASGGAFSSIPEIRRCGCGIVTMTPANDDSDKFDLEWAASFPLEGEIQTVPRAELFAILILLQNLQHQASVIIVSDSLVNIQLYYKGKAHALASTNGDLWVGVFKKSPTKTSQ